MLAFKDAYWEEDRAKVVMADLIVAYPQIDGIWADGAQMAAGALKALIAAGRPLVPVSGDDYNGLLKVYDAHKDKAPNFKIGLVSEPSWEGGGAQDRGEAAGRRGGAQAPDHRSHRHRRQQLPEIHQEGPAGRRLVDTLLTDEQLKKLSG